MSVELALASRAGRNARAHLLTAADLANQNDEKIFEDTFANLDNWTTTGTPTNGTITVSGGVATIDDTSAAGSLQMLLASSQYFTQQVRPFTVEVVMSKDSSLLIQVQLKANAAGSGGTSIMSVLTLSGSSITHQVDGGAINTVTPSNWDGTNKFRLVWAVDPKAKTVRPFIMHKDSLGDDQFTALEAARSFTSDYVESIVFNTNSASTGAATVEEVKVYDSFAVLIGDSVSSGHPGWDPVPSFYASPDETSNVGYWLEQGFGGRRRVRNHGKGGDSTVELLARYEDWVLAFKPRLAIYWIGTNDIGAEDIATAKTNLRTIVQATLDAGIAVAVVNCAPRDNMTAAENTLKAEWNAWLPGFCASLGATLADVHDALADPDDSTVLWPPFTTDNIHPSALGHRAAAQQVWNGLAGSAD